MMQGFDHNFIHILQCVLEAVEESLGEDRTEKHFLAFLQDVFEQVQTMRPSANLIWEYLTFWIHQDFDKDVLSGMSDRLISTVNSLLENHVLHYSCIDSGHLNYFSAIGGLPFTIKVHIAQCVLCSVRCPCIFYGHVVTTKKKGWLQGHTWGWRGGCRGIFRRKSRI